MISTKSEGVLFNIRTTTSNHRQQPYANSVFVLLSFDPDFDHEDTQTGK